ncbi:hypothetical protein K438DRAFT_1781143 [Mycena galopus ATCC 62051]|nr:hypothetical protein K438DRAFT_1781143 [Mycena galopus ATCC 62051]
MKRAWVLRSLASVPRIDTQVWDSKPTLMLWLPLACKTRSGAEFSAFSLPRDTAVLPPTVAALQGGDFDVAPLLANAVAREGNHQEDQEDDDVEDVPAPDPWDEVDNVYLTSSPGPSPGPLPGPSATTKKQQVVASSKKPHTGPHRRRAPDPTLKGPSTQHAKSTHAAHSRRTNKHNKKRRDAGHVPTAATASTHVKPTVPLATDLSPPPSPPPSRKEVAKCPVHSQTSLVSGFMWCSEMEWAEARFPASMHKHHRGLFAVINIGLSYGKGQTTGWLLTNPYLNRLASFADSAFALWVPRLYAHYRAYDAALRHRYPHLRCPFECSIFFCAAVNFGPNLWTYQHRDVLNLPFGWCAVQALGNFDATKGGHLVLWDLKLVVEFPAGALILLPSATITHSNIPVQPGEERVSFTQFSAGGIFRYVDNNFQTVKDLQFEEPAEYERLMAQRASRWEHGLSLLSTLDELLVIYFHTPDWPQNLGGMSRRNLTTVKFSGCSRNWRERNADKRCEAAKLRMQRLRAGIAKSDYHTRRKYRAQAAEHSEQYCDRQAQKERVERGDTDATKHRARKQEADALQASHRAVPTTSSTQGPRPPPKKMPRACPLHASSFQRALREKSPDNEEDGDGKESDTTCPRIDEPFFPGRISPCTAVGRPCPGCGLYNCPSCTCMCTESTEWVDHPGGHFFPDCKKCGGTECPGYWVEHGGHLISSSPLGGFFAIVHEQWKGVVTSKKTRDRMLDAYTGASTFNTPSWSSFQDLWTLDCNKHDHMDASVPHAPSHLPSLGPPGSLPTEDARRREADFKECLLHSFALNRVLLVPTSQEDLGELFTTFLGVPASDIEECMEAWVRSGPPAPGGDLASLRRRIAEEIEEVLASGSFSSIYMTTPAMAQLSGTFNTHAHTDRCATQWAEAMAQREGMGQHNSEGSERHWD